MQFIIIQTWEFVKMTNLPPITWMAHSKIIRILKRKNPKPRALFQRRFPSLLSVSWRWFLLFYKNPSKSHRETPPSLTFSWRRGSSSVWLSTFWLSLTEELKWTSMATSLASQLQGLRAVVKADGEALKRPFTRPSILYNPKDAADLSNDQILEDALTGTIENFSLLSN